MQGSSSVWEGSGGFGVIWWPGERFKGGSGGSGVSVRSGRSKDSAGFCEGSEVRFRRVLRGTKKSAACCWGYHLSFFLFFLTCSRVFVDLVAAGVLLLTRSKVCF